MAERYCINCKVLTVASADTRESGGTREGHACGSLRERPRDRQCSTKSSDFGSPPSANFLKTAYCSILAPTNIRAVPQKAITRNTLHVQGEAYSSPTRDEKIYSLLMMDQCTAGGLVRFEPLPACVTAGAPFHCLSHDLDVHSRYPSHTIS